MRERILWWISLLLANAVYRQQNSKQFQFTSIYCTGSYALVTTSISWHSSQTAFNLTYTHFQSNFLWLATELLRPSLLYLYCNPTNLHSNVKLKLSYYNHGGTCGKRKHSSYSFFTSALDGAEWSASRPGHDLPPGKELLVPVGQKAGWASEPVWTQAKKNPLPLPRIESRSPVVQSVSDTILTELHRRNQQTEANYNQADDTYRSSLSYHPSWFSWILPSHISHSHHNEILS
jgi:hypothetical protein